MAASSLQNGQFSDEHTEADILIKDYQSEFVLTLDELPDWDNLINAPVEGDVNADGAFNVADESCFRNG